MIDNNDEIDLSGYYKRVVPNINDLSSGCFLDDLSTIHFLIPDKDKNESLSDILERFSSTDSMLCEQLDDNATIERLSVFIDNMIKGLSSHGKLVITRNIILLSGAATLLYGYEINGRSVGSILDSLYSEQVRIGGWLHVGGLGPFEYRSTVKMPAELVLFGLNYYNIMDNDSNKPFACSVYKSKTIGILVNKFRDGLGKDNISRIELLHLFCLSAYITYDDADDRIKDVAKNIVSYFLSSIESMDNQLSLMRKEGKIPVD